MRARANLVRVHMHILGRPVQMLKGIPLQSEIYEVKIMVKWSKKNGSKTFI